MSWSVLSVSGHPLSQIRTRTPRSIHTGPPSAVNVPELAMIQNGSPAGRRKANVMANIFIVKLQLSTIVRSLLCAVAALAVERRSVTRIRGKCSKCSTSRVLVESRATLKLSARFQPSVSGLLTTRVAPSVTAFIGLAPITAYKRRCCSRSYETRRPVPDERGNRMDNIGRTACSAGVRNNFL